MSAPLPTGIEPRDGERVLSRRWANRTQLTLRAVGGRLFVTTRRVLFCPHAVDAALNGEYWWSPLEAITGLDKQKKSLRASFSGGLRTRLRIELDDGSNELFVVNKLDVVISEIQVAKRGSH